jgi:hypothetical protein
MLKEINDWTAVALALAVDKHIVGFVAAFHTLVADRLGLFVDIDCRFEVREDSLE